jgi:hypothetical protein
MKYKLITFLLLFVIETKAQSNKKRELHSNWYFKIETMDKKVLKGRLYKIDSSSVTIRQKNWNAGKDSILTSYTNLYHLDINNITYTNDNMIYFGLLGGAFIGTIVGFINVFLTPNYQSRGLQFFTQKEEAFLMMPYFVAAGGLIGTSAGLVKFKYNLNGNPNKYKKIYRKLGNKILH